jgi:hypothetical protein
VPVARSPRGSSRGLPTFEWTAARSTPAPRQHARLRNPLGAVGRPGLHPHLWGDCTFWPASPARQRTAPRSHERRPQAPHVEGAIPRRVHRSGLAQLAPHDRFDALPQDEVTAERTSRTSALNVTGAILDNADRPLRPVRRRRLTLGRERSSLGRHPKGNRHHGLHDMARTTRIGCPRLECGAANGAVPTAHSAGEHDEGLHPQRGAPADGADGTRAHSVPWHPSPSKKYNRPAVRVQARTPDSSGDHRLRATRPAHRQREGQGSPQGNRGSPAPQRHPESGLRPANAARSRAGRRHPPRRPVEADGQAEVLSQHRAGVERGFGPTAASVCIGGIGAACFDPRAVGPKPRAWADAGS